MIRHPEPVHHACTHLYTLLEPGSWNYLHVFPLGHLPLKKNVRVV